MSSTPPYSSDSGDHAMSSTADEPSIPQEVARQVQANFQDEGLSAPAQNSRPTSARSSRALRRGNIENQSADIPSLSRATSVSASSKYDPSVWQSRDLQSQFTDEINGIKCEVMASWLHSKQEEKLWTSGGEGEGVVLKRSRGIYTCAPSGLVDEEDGLFDAVRALNVKVSSRSDLICFWTTG
jgi:hypothetical protein